MYSFMPMFKSRNWTMGVFDYGKRTNGIKWEYILYETLYVEVIADRSCEWPCKANSTPLGGHPWISAELGRWVGSARLSSPCITLLLIVHRSMWLLVRRIQVGRAHCVFWSLSMKVENVVTSRNASSLGSTSVSSLSLLLLISPMPMLTPHFLKHLGIVSGPGVSHGSLIHWSVSLMVMDSTSWEALAASSMLMSRCLSRYFLCSIFMLWVTRSSTYLLAMM